MAIRPIVQTLSGWLLVVVVSVGVLAIQGRALAASAKAAAIGSSHACAVTTGGGLKCWGANDSGQLGDGTTTERLTPTAVSGLASGVAAIAVSGCYGSYTCALMGDGGLKCWGANPSGELGDGTKTSRSSPADVFGLTSGVAGVSVGRSHTCAVTTGGAAVCWGANFYGQLGDGTTTQRLTPTGVAGLTSGVSSVAVGDRYSCALTTGGGVKCWGDNYFGQLGDGTTTSRWTPADVSGLASGVAAVAAGYNHACAVMASGALRCWGDNGGGQLGDGTTTGRSTPVDASGLTSGVAAATAGISHTCAVTTAGNLRCWGANLLGEVGDGSAAMRRTPVVVAAPGSGVATAAAGGYSTCSTTAGGGLKCWGANGYGQLGIGTRALSTTPLGVPGLSGGVATMSLGPMHACALTTGGAVKCWGYNGSGQVGDGTMGSRTSPVGVASLASGVAAVSAGGQHTCALTAEGGVTCWGYDGAGRVDASPVGVSGLASGVVAVAAGGYHACALAVGGGVTCWGRNNYGQLGDGTAADRQTPGAVSGLTSGVSAVTGGFLHTCALTTGGGVKCWGYNWAGQLGDGTTTDRSTPVDVVGLANGVSAIAAGWLHTCALTTVGGVKCWGYDWQGQLGDGATQTSRSTPVAVSGLASGVAAVSAGDSHTCALTTAGGVKCWGSNLSGQLGDGTTLSHVTPVNVPGLTSGVAAIAAGSSSTCAVTTLGAARCWGSGLYGQLGDPRYGFKSVPARALTFGRADFDADDKADVAVYRPSSGTWFSLDSSVANSAMRYRGFGLQAQGDTPIVGDFDGDGIIDPTVFRPASGTWFVLKSGANFTTWEYFGWGNATDVLVPGDYDGDGITDAAVYRPSEGRWYVRPSSGAAAWNVAFGNATDVPVAGDFDGDGRRDPAVYRASTGTWFWLKSSTSHTTYDYRGWGVNAQGDTPAPGDYDGDGKTDPCVFRPGTGTWFVLESSAAYVTWSYFGWGSVGDTVVPADYDGDGRTDGAVYRASNGTWYVRPSSGASQWSVRFGQAADVPLVTTK